jgi:hypothetical protein
MALGIAEEVNQKGTTNTMPKLLHIKLYFSRQHVHVAIYLIAQ